MLNTYKIYSPDKEHEKVNLFKLTNSENVHDYVFDTKETPYWKALNTAEKAGYKII